MTQSTDIVLSPNISGTAQRTELNDIIGAIVTNHGGASRPGYLPAKSGWTKEVSATIFELYWYDGTDDILMGTINAATNTYSPAGQLASFGNAVDNKTAAYTIVSGDLGKLITANATAGAFSLAIDSASTLPAGWFSIIQKTDATANAVTLDPAGVETINGVTTLELTRQFDSLIVIRSTTSAFIALRLPNGALLAPLNSPALTGTPTAPTAAGGTNTTQIATTAFVAAALSGATIGGGDVQTFTASGTWTKPSGYTPSSIVLIELWGAGGSGGRLNGANGGGGGGGGSYVARYVQLSSLGASESVTIGAGGAASAGIGANGGASSFGSIATAYGGSGGASASSTGGAAGGARATAAAGSQFNDTRVLGSGGASAGGSGGEWIGGGGGALANSGGASIFGGGGGGGTGGAGGLSARAGNGGAGGSTGTSGSAPAGGGGAASLGSPSGAGARGEARITVIG